jgi:hypothetical protein
MSQLVLKDLRRPTRRVAIGDQPTLTRSGPVGRDHNMVRPCSDFDVLVVQSCIDVSGLSLKPGLRPFYRAEHPLDVRAVRNSSTK